MPTPIYGWKDDYLVNSPVSSADLNSRADIAESQIQGALASIGVGVLDGFAVIDNGGLDVSIEAGQTIIHSPVYGYEQVSTTTNTLLNGLTDNTDNYIFVTFPTNPYTTPGEPLFLFQTLDILADGQPLAKVTTLGGVITNIEDLRSLPRAEALSFDLVGVGRIVGADTTLHKPIPTPADASITLPSGNIYIIGEKRVKLTADVIIPITAFDNASKYGFLTLDELTGLPTILDENWYTLYPTGTTLQTLKNEGAPCVGLVTMAAGIVTAIDATLEDLVYTQAGIINIINNLPGGGGGTGVSQADFDSLHDFVYNTVWPAVLALQAALGSGTTFSSATNDLDFERFCILLASQLRDRPEDLTVYPGSINVPGFQGNNESFIDGTNAQSNVVTGDWNRDDSGHFWN